MNHDEHKKAIRRAAILSIILLIPTLICISAFVLLVSAVSDKHQLVTLCVIVAFLTSCSSVIDMKLYNSSKTINNNSIFTAWSTLCKFKLALIGISVVALSLDQLLFNNYHERRINILLAVLLIISAVIHHCLYRHLKAIHEDCVIKCSFPDRWSTHNAGYEELETVRIEPLFGDSPPAYETIDSSQKCPSYEEIVIQVQDLPENETRYNNMQSRANLHLQSIPEEH